MAGTFCVGDALLVHSVPLSKVLIGDVIVFYPPDGHVDSAHTIVAHRVQRRVAGGVATQGDARASSDVSVVDEAHLLGRVERVLRGHKSCAVWSGFAGRLWARYVRLRHRLLALGRAPYRWVRASGIVRRLWRPSFAQVTLATEQGVVVKYLCNGKTAAVWRPAARVYWCRKPYDLVMEAPVSRIHE